MRRNLTAWCCLAVLSGIVGSATSVTGCEGSVDHVRAVPSGAGGAGAAGGEGGTGGEAPSRGDPSQFPTDCLATCAEACDRLQACGGESASLYPLGADDCLTRCGLAENGPAWNDISGHFKCCASQPDCADVQYCGGWLANPAVEGSCQKVCQCFFAGAVAAATAGHSPPEGYRFAPDLLMVDTEGRSAPLALVPGVQVIAEGPRPLLRLGQATDSRLLAELARMGRVLPTFVDRAGRVSAATGTVVLAVHSAAELAAAEAIAAHHGFGPARASKLHIVRDAPADIYLLDGRDGWQSLDALAELGTVPGLRAELDMVRYYQTRYTPSDPLFADQWHLLNVGQNGSTAGVDGRVSEAWDTTLGDPGVIIGINDDGTDLDHPDFAGRLEPELNYPVDWQTQMAAGTFGGHGTSCTGVAAAGVDNDTCGSGVCPHCRILPHLLGPSTAAGFQVTDADIANGFTQMVDAGAAVISNSWGVSTGDPVYQAPSLPVPGLAAVVQAAFDYAETTGRGGLGTVIVFAAGNSNDTVDPTSGYVTNLAVAAVSDLGLKSYYSSFGPEIDIAAPSNGGLIGITTTAANSACTADFGGTSSACPYIAGVAGLVLSANPNLTAAEVRAAITSSATKIDPVFGQWDGDGHSVFYGAGLVNAYQAVQLATGACTDPATCPAPSDDCGASCGTLTSCALCRTAADCASGHVCQAMPSLGALVCVAAKGANPCPQGTIEREGYCLPLPETCGFCSATELCNGRDDDCDGQVDEDNVCQGPPRCFFDRDSCGDAGQVCAGTHCVSICTSNDGCSSPATCETLKDAYGAIPGTKGCIQTTVNSCQIGCEVLASSTEDAVLNDFVSCMQDGATSCGAAYACVQKLPITM